MDTRHLDYILYKIKIDMRPQYLPIEYNIAVNPHAHTEN